MPVVSIDAMNQHLAEISKCVSISAIALLILTVLVGAVRRDSSCQKYRAHAASILRA